MERIKLFNDHFQNYKVYGIPKAQLVITDIPYNVGNNAYASNPQWYEDGQIENGQSKLAGKTFFDTDERFKIPEFMHFCSKMLKPEPKEKSDAACMLVFCSFEQQWLLIEEGKKHGLNRFINFVFCKSYSSQVLKANMRVVGNSEYAIMLYRDKLPKFRNKGSMVFNCIDWPNTRETQKLHPTQKPIVLLEYLIETFTDPDDVVIDPCAGSGAHLLAASNLGRRAYGFEIKKNFYNAALEFLKTGQPSLFEVSCKTKNLKYTQNTLLGGNGA